MTHRLLQLLIGLFLYGIGIALIVRGAVGVAPWDVLTQGIDSHVHLGFGLVTTIISGIVLLLWIPLRQRLGIGTVANALLVGPSADVGLWLIPADLTLWVRVLLFASGLVLLAVASGIYIGADLGTGPRDGLMTGLHRRLGWPIWLCRLLVESTVLVAGWMLGGTVGVGTVIFAVCIGPLVHRALPLFDLAKRRRVPVEA